jgi:hypothetical protein
MTFHPSARACSSIFRKKSFFVMLMVLQQSSNALSKVMFLRCLRFLAGLGAAHLLWSLSAAHGEYDMIFHETNDANAQEMPRRARKTLTICVEKSVMRPSSSGMVSLK